jgi:hypothetical protein
MVNPSTSSESLFSFQQFTTCDVLDALLKNDVKHKNKSTGTDMLDPFLLQLSAPLISESLTHMIISGTIPKV